MRNLEKNAKGTIVITLILTFLQIGSLSMAQEAEPNYLKYYHLNYFNNEYYIKAYNTGTSVMELSNGKMVKSKNHTEPTGDMMIFVQMPTVGESENASILLNNEELGYFVSFLKRMKSTYMKWLERDTKGKERKMRNDLEFESHMMLISWDNPTRWTSFDKLKSKFEFDENGQLLISIRKKVIAFENRNVSEIIHCVFSNVEEIDNLIEMLDLQKMIGEQQVPDTQSINN